MPTLVYDTETTSLVLSKEKPSHPDQPHLVELGCILFNDKNEECAQVGVIVKPDGFTIPESAAAVHGITTEMALQLGIPLIIALAIFSNLAKIATRHVAHNIDFDIKVMMAEFHRMGKPFPPLNARCTKDMAEPITRLPPTERMIEKNMGHKFKSPKLVECTQFLFGEEIVGAHSALADAKACARVFFELERRVNAAKS